MVLSPEEVAGAWRETVGADDLPFSLNPDAGYLASANNAPAPAEVPIGYFFSPDDRVERMARLVVDETPLAVEDVARLQRDVYMASSVELRDLFLEVLRRAGMDASLAAREREAVVAMAAWDGRYEPDAKGPVAFELFRAGFTSTFYEHALGASDWAAFANFSRIKQVMREDIAGAPAERLERALRAGLAAAAEDMGSYDDWGALHRLALNHPLGMLPVIGERYRFADFPVAGSTDTLYKTSHGLVEDRHRTSYGSTARHISDLADPDRNYFVLLGGQDGWFNSSTFLDQLPLWRSGAYLQVPLRLETVRRTFKTRTVLRPAAN